MKTLANSIMKMRRNSFRQMLIFCPNLWKCLEIGSRDGRTFASHQYDPGSIPAWCHMLVELFAGSHLEFSPRSPIFLPLQDSSQHLIFTIQLDGGPAWKPPKGWCGFCSEYCKFDFEICKILHWVTCNYNKT